MRVPFRRLLTVAAAVAIASPAAVELAPGGADAAPPPIGKTAFAMHYLGYGKHPYPVMPFGSGRIWDDGVTWADLQPTPTTTLDGNNPVVQRLDGLVNAYRSHGVQPLIVLGMTPTWAADNCSHGSWPATTCGPTLTGNPSPWASYVQFLANRYHNIFFEMWNEPNLRNGWNDTVPKMAAMQATAYSVIHGAGTGDRLLSPTVAVTADNPLGWLNTFFHSPGGKKFDIMAIHLYPSDKAAKAGYGPEWSVDYLNQRVRPLLRNNRVNTTVWDTETNVGRKYVGISFSGMTAAAMAARTYILQVSSQVARIYWYAADERNVTGVWMEQSNYKSLTDAGLAEKTAYRLLVGARPYGCTHTTRGVIRYTCKFHLKSGKNALVEWTTGRSAYIHAPSHTSGIYSTVGGYARSHGGASVKVTTVPKYIVGTFSL